jgi:tetratricopeptide (TPR) repeat protein
MRPRRQLRTLALFACFAAAAWSSPGPALAQDTTSANVVAARQHFEKARTFYGQGAYREAVAELEAAHTLDPSAKDLVFNLGVVHEKLSDIDDALQWFELYTTMSLTAQERERADAYIRRLEGAKREVAEKKQDAEPAPFPSARPPLQPTDLGPPPARPAHGRIDTATIAAASVAGGALVFGTIMGIKALADRPANGFVLGQDGSWTQLNDRTASAHREAVVADIGFSVAIAAGVATGLLYFVRPKHVSRGASAPPSAPSVSVAPLVGGGALVVQGSFR